MIFNINKVIVGALKQINIKKLNKMVSHQEIIIKEEINNWEEYSEERNTNHFSEEINKNARNFKENFQGYIKPEFVENNVDTENSQVYNNKNDLRIETRCVAVKEELDSDNETNKSEEHIFTSVISNLEKDEDDVSNRNGSFTGIFTSEIKPLPAPDNSTKPPGKTKTYQCELCLHYFFRLSGLNKHKRTHANMGELPFRCMNCPSKFASLKELQNHGNLEHPDCRPFKCDGCGKGFKKIGKLNVHRRVHTGERRYPCDLCGKAFGELGTLKAHRRIHTGERPYVCQICKRGFTTVSKLRVHERTHSGIRPYKCDECGRAFSQLDNLNSHKFIHTGERPYECPTCKKKLRSRSNFNVHIRTHTGERPYVCTICFKVFAEVGSLTVHRRVHTGERPYECKICQKRFAVNSQWNVHMRIHTGEKPYCCNLCGKRFTQLGHMNAHKRVHDNENTSTTTSTNNNNSSNSSSDEMSPAKDDETSEDDDDEKTHAEILRNPLENIEAFVDNSQLKYNVEKSGVELVQIENIRNTPSKNSTEIPDTPVEILSRDKRCLQGNNIVQISTDKITNFPSLVNFHVGNSGIELVPINDAVSNVPSVEISSKFAIGTSGIELVPIQKINEKNADNIKNNKNFDDTTEIFKRDMEKVIIKEEIYVENDYDPVGD